MKKPTLLVAMLAMVLLASAPALTQTTPSDIELSSGQETEAVQTVEDAEVAQPTTTSDPAAAPSTPPLDQAAAPSTPPTPECGWYENPERGWGWDYWCYHPTQSYWEPVFYGVT